MKNISYFSDLVRALRDHPDLALVFGFHPLKLPQVENFSAFLADTDNGILQEVRNVLIGKLIKSGEIRETCNIVDSRVIIPQLRKVRDEFSFHIGAVIADSALDSAKVLSFIIRDLKAKPYIARNMRREKELPVTRSGNRICLAGFEMLYWGKYQEGKRTRIKFVCPIIHFRKFREKHPYCLWMHPQFAKGTGCFAYRQLVDEDIRKQINYCSKEFKKVYNLRSGSERNFSRLLGLCKKNPSVRGLRAISNHCTIAHIAVLLVALAADRIGNKDKIHFVKSFLPTI